MSLFGAGLRRGRRAVVPAVVLLVCPLAAVGCGGGDDDGKGGAAKASAPSKSSAKPLKIAVLLNATGPALSGNQYAPPVLQAWAKDVNAKGGVAGHPVAFDIHDLKADPTKATAAAAKVSADPDVVAMLSFDPYTETVYAKTVAKAGLAVIGGYGSAPNVWAAEKNWLPLVTTFPSSINAPFIAGKARGARRTAAVVCAEYPTCAAIGPIAKNASSKLGLDYASTVKVSLTSPDYTAPCLQLKQQQVDLVDLTLDATSNMRFAKACHTQGFSGTFAMSDGSIGPKVMAETDLGVPILTTVTAFPWWVDAPPVKAYQDLMKRSGVDDDAWGNPNGSAAYAAMELFRKTLDATKAQLPSTPTRKDIIAAYGNVRDESLDGLVPQPISFTPDAPQQHVTCFWVSQFEHGKFSGAELDKPTCDPPELAG